MPALLPTSSREMADALSEAAAHGRTIQLIGNNSKRLLAGPLTPAEVTISTTALNRVLRYEPNDLTISVGAGFSFARLQELLREHGQMVALDPPFSRESSVGGVVAANLSGPSSRGFGTARDLVIGVEFATLEGKVANSGGMVVKNVAGLDMAKVLIGSFGTLAAITSINFRLHPRPAGTRTFVFTAPDADAITAHRETITRSSLRPFAMDIVSPTAAPRFNRRGFLLGVRAGGSEAVLDRYQRELEGAEVLSRDDEKQFWLQIREFGPDFSRRSSGGIVLRITAPVSETAELLRNVSGPSVTRAASGVTEVLLPSWQGVVLQQRLCVQKGWDCLIVMGPEEVRANNELWVAGASGGAFDMMKSVKRMFDPGNLLNARRLYGRI